MGEFLSNVAFPPTHHSVVLAVQSSDPEERTRAFDALVTAYWRAVHRHLRLRWGASDEDAKDLAQGFFASAFEKGHFARFEPARGRFRTYLLTCLDGFAANERRSRRRLKRGGDLTHVPLDAPGTDGQPRPLDIADRRDLEAGFQQEWARSLFALGIEALRARCRGTPREIAFTLFERYDLETDGGRDRPSYAELALDYALPATQVTNHLAWARREFRAAVLEKLREITAGEDEFRAEARALLGIVP